MNENEKTQFRKDLKEFLHDGVVNVCFEKKDGTERIMKCTLQSNLIPEEHTPKGTGTAKENLDIIHWTNPMNEYLKETDRNFDLIFINI